LTQKLKEEVKQRRISAAQTTNKLEHKYAAEIKKVTASFEAFKKEAQQNLQTIKAEKDTLQT